MTQFEVAYSYSGRIGDEQMRALNNIREIYGVRRIAVNETERVVRVEFDASRFKEPVMAGLLRRAGVDITERLP
jgi:hypothetical protein